MVWRAVESSFSMFIYDYLARRAKQLSDYGKGAWTANGLKSRRDNYNVLSFNEMARQYSGLDLCADSWC